MREILFKAKRLENGEWVEGNLVQSEDVDDDFKVIIIPLKESWMYTEEYSNDIGFEGWYKVDPTTLCQYTGLTDKNGKRIWENDILVEKHKGIVTMKYRVVFDLEEGAWMLETKSGARYGIGAVNQRNFEVCGNVFDDSELLEVE